MDVVRRVAEMKLQWVTRQDQERLAVTLTQWRREVGEDLKNGGSPISFKLQEGVGTGVQRTVRLEELWPISKSGCRKAEE